MKLKKQIKKYLKNCVPSNRKEIESLEALNDWFEVIWEDRWYDHSFMLIVWQRKLEIMIENWDGAHYKNSEKDQKKMIKTLRYLNLLIEDEFDCMFESKEIGVLEQYTKGQREKNKIEKKLFKIIRKNYAKWWD